MAQPTETEVKLEALTAQVESARQTQLIMSLIKGIGLPVNEEVQVMTILANHLTALVAALP